MTCSESPSLTAATSCYGTNTMIDNICTADGTGHYILKKCYAVEQQIIQICPTKIWKTAKILSGCK